MKKTVRWFVAAVAFFTVGILLFGNISEILRKKSGGESDMIHSFYGVEENTVDVLCMGSSHGYSSFQPNTLWNEYGLTSCVLCSQRQTAAMTYYLLKEALNYQKPKVLLLETYYFFEKKKYSDEAALRMGFDGARMGEAKYAMAEDLLGGKGFREKLTYYLPFLKYHSRWEELKNLDFHSKTFLRGSIFDFDVYPMEEPELPQNADGKQLPKTIRKYLGKIRELCEENDIELILYTAPFGWKDKKNSYLNKQRMNLALEEYLGDRDIPYLSFQRGNKAGVDYAADFRDYAHMNTNGAIKITRYLGRYLTENCGLEDHRGDGRYRSYEEDYEQFREAMEEV